MNLKESLESYGYDLSEFTEAQIEQVLNIIERKNIFLGMTTSEIIGNLVNLIKEKQTIQEVSNGAYIQR